MFYFKPDWCDSLIVVSVISEGRYTIADFRCCFPFGSIFE